MASTPPPPSLATALDVDRATYHLKAAEFEHHKSEAARAKWLTWLNFLVSALVGLAAIVVTWSQHSLAVNDDRRREQEQALHTAEDVRRADELSLKKQAAYVQERANWFKAVQDNDARINSEDPAVRCRYRKLLSTLVSDAFFQQNYGALGVPVSFCGDPHLLQLAIQGKQDGAPPGWMRRDPATNTALSIQCAPVRSSNLHGRPDIVPSGSCALPANVPPDAKIYDVGYSCAEYACSWSYNDKTGGYEKHVELDGDRRKFTWWRKWDGDPVTEIYTIYYEIAVK